MTRSDPAISLRWRAFELRPEPVPSLDPQGEYLTRVWRDHVYPLAERIGMPLKLPALQPRTRLAHEAAKWAEHQGKAQEFQTAVFRQFFEWGNDIGAIEVLAEAVAGLGLDPSGLREALERGTYSAQVLADEQEARLLGIRAVPAFVADRRFLAAGVQTAKRLKELLQKP